MTDTIDAVATSDEIKATYRRYLQSLLAVRDPKPEILPAAPWK